MSGWIGVDLDGTLAEYHGWAGEFVIGEPIQPMVDRVKQWLDDGMDVRIFTARVRHDMKLVDPIVRNIMDWSRKHIGVALMPTCVKDMHMIELWDDSAVQVEQNTGRRMDGVEMPGNKWFRAQQGFTE